MMIFTTLVLFLIYILQVSGAEKEEDVLYFKDIQSEQQREEWDQLPLISQTRTTSDWCEVTADPSQVCHESRNHGAFLSEDGGGGGDQRDGGETVFWEVPVGRRRCHRRT